VIVQGVALPTLYWPVDKVDSRLRPGDLNLVDYNTCHICQSAWSESTDVLSCTPCLVVVPDKVAWVIFWKVFCWSCGPPTGSVGPTIRLASLLIGQTHLSGMTVSLVGGDPVVPMSHSGCGTTTVIHAQDTL
jgi:hypothetical protein